MIVEREVEPEVEGVYGVLGGPMEPFRRVGVTCCISNGRHMLGHTGGIGVVILVYTGEKEKVKKI